MLKSNEDEHRDHELAFERGSGNIFKDLGFPDDEAASMLVRGQLAIEIRKIIADNGWSQRRAAKEMDIAQPRVAELMKMRIEHFTIDTLIKYLGKLNRKVSFVVKHADEVA
jgi:predicted XRE-type DNA-binding protein